jgi:hypothetical protein
LAGCRRRAVGILTSTAEITMRTAFRGKQFRGIIKGNIGLSAVVLVHTFGKP